MSAGNSVMDDTDSIMTDFSLVESPRPFKELPKSAENSLHSEDLTSSSSDAVIRALKTLQEKIKKLELERLQAENKFGNLEKETNQYKELFKEKNEKKTAMFRLEPTTTSSPVDKQTARNTHSEDTAGTSHKFESGEEKKLVSSGALYCPSQSQPYATYVRPSKVSEEKESPAAQKMHDSRVSILEKQLEYMRRLVHNAEQERIKATDKISSIEQQKTDQVERATETELERQNKKISELEQECEKLGKAHNSAEYKITDLQSKLLSEKENHHKLLLQTDELTRVTEENKNLMLSLTPSLPPSPVEKTKKKRKRPSGSGSSAAARASAERLPAPPRDWKNIPFVCGRSAHPSHSLAANVQQMLSALKHSEKPSVCARITTQRKKSSGNVGKEIKQVISGLEDDLGSLTFEYQKRCSAKETVASQQQLKQISQQMENKSSQIKKLNSCLKKLEQEERVVRAQVVPSAHRPLATLSNKEVQISVKGRDRRELLSKVKNIRDVITNKDLQWV